MPGVGGKLGHLGRGVSGPNRTPCMAHCAMCVCRASLSRIELRTIGKGAVAIRYRIAAHRNCSTAYRVSVRNILYMYIALLVCTAAQDFSSGSSWKTVIAI